MATGLKLYPVLVRALGPMPYAAKFLGVAFVGTHLPLLALVAYALARHGVDLRDQLDVLAVALAGTLAATALTLRAIHGLLEPVHATRDALRDYLARGVLVPLPERFRDAGGTLMRDVGFALRQLDARLRELEGVAATDHLTGLMNRRAGEEALRVALAPAAEGGGAAGGVFHLLKIDVDDFKAVNDRFGHTVGDACLRRLAEVARSVLREGDWIAAGAADELVAGIAAERDDHATSAVRAGSRGRWPRSGGSRSREAAGR
jgi:GGDEF domain-containing protein